MNCVPPVVEATQSATVTNKLGARFCLTHSFVPVLKADISSVHIRHDLGAWDDFVVYLSIQSCDKVTIGALFWKMVLN